MAKKRKFKPLFTKQEIKTSIQETKLEQNKDEHSKETVQIPDRPIICKKCKHEFMSQDIKLYQCFAYEDRVVAYCLLCTTANKIKKTLFFPDRH